VTGAQGMTGLGVTEPPAREPLFPVAPTEAFRPGSGFRVGGDPARGMLEFASRRAPPRSWRRGVPLPPGMVREEHLFEVAWVGVAPLADCHGDVGLLDPESVFADRAGEGLPGGAELARDAATMLEALTSLMEALSVERRLLVRLAQLVERAGVGTPAGIRLRRALTHVQWPLLVGADEDALVAAFRGLIGRGWLMVDGRSLIVPWEAWQVYTRDADAPRGP
jgi:hypothetical protein